MSEALPVPLSVVADLRRARQKQRIKEIHWVDALYQVYVTGIVVIAGVGVLSTVIGDERLSPASVQTYRTDAPGMLGLVVAFALFIGLRSGSRGGPLAVEAADVRHILMAPVDRGGALRGPALRQLRFVAFASVGVGAAAGQFGGRRFASSNALEWIGCGALFGLMVAGLLSGAALFASSRRIPTWLATSLGGALVAWAGADVVYAGAPTAPTTFVGRMGTWPLEFDPLALGGLALAAVLLVLGITGIAGLSLEAAERRSSLVGQLRFAVTLQDLRTVLVLRRQLAADLPRSRPWIKARRAAGQARFPVWQRGWRGVLRWPLPRVLRVLGVGVLAGVAVHGVLTGTSPLLVAAGLLLWMAGLDAVEPMAQETDHPGRRDAYPMEEGELMLRHLPVPLVVMTIVSLVAAGTAAALGGTTRELQVMAVAVIPMALAGGAGAVTSVLMGAPKPFDELAMASPEIAGLRTVLRTVWPPLVACAGVLPVQFAARVQGPDSEAVSVATTAAAAVLVLVTLVFGWVRVRARIKAWWEEASKAAMNPTAGRDDEADEYDDDEADEQSHEETRR